MVDGFDGTRVESGCASCGSGGSSSLGVGGSSFVGGGGGALE